MRRRTIKHLTVVNRNDVLANWHALDIVCRRYVEKMQLKGWSLDYGTESKVDESGRYGTYLYMYKAH